MISDSPGFNTDKIDIPVLFEENDPVALVYSGTCMPPCASEQAGRALICAHVSTSSGKPLERLLRKK